MPGFYGTFFGLFVVFQFLTLAYLWFNSEGQTIPSNRSLTVASIGSLTLVYLLCFVAAPTHRRDTIKRIREAGEETMR